MKERPILFSAPMVRAILDGRKTQTRRVVKLPKSGDFDGVRVADGAFLWSRPHQPTGTNEIKSPYGIRGDRLWARETWHQTSAGDFVFFADYPENVIKRGFDNIPAVDAVKWKPSIHMPRKASRITLEVTGVRVERLQNISEVEAVAEGVKASVHWHHRWQDYESGDDDATTACDSFASLWRSINGADSWAANPWVWVVEFKRVTP